MMAMHTSDMALQMSMTGLAFFPAAIMPKPNTTAMTMTCSIVASAMGWKKFEREHIHDSVDERRRLGGLVGKLACGHRVAGADVHEVGEHKPQRNGAGGGGQVEQHGFAADGANLLHVIQRHDASDDGEQHQRYDDHLDEVQEDGAEGLDVGVGDLWRALQRETRQHAQDERDEDRGGQRQALEPGLWLADVRSHCRCCWASVRPSRRRRRVPK